MQGRRRWRRVASGVGLGALWLFDLLTLMCTTIRPAWKHDPIHMQWRYGITLGLAGMTAWCFGMTVTRPSFYVHTAPLPTCLTVKHSTGKARWCNKCMAPKPDRCHHCRQCERCILRMDHHCPWLMDTCIGLRNYKPFLLFLVYAILLCVWTCDTLARGFLRHWDDSLAHNHAVDIPLAWLGLFGLAALFSLALIPFLLYHMYLVLNNKTTLESLEGLSNVRPAQDAMSTAAPSTSTTRLLHLSTSNHQRRRTGPKYNVYNVGIWTNMQQALGPAWWLWGVPIGPLASDGLSFPINESTLHALQTAPQTQPPTYRAVG